MKWRQIETSREIRLWIGQIIVPVATAVMVISPEARRKVADGFNHVKNSISDKARQIKYKLTNKGS